jgi:Zn finger protein HypA/HybF involved in hydrogenase expression
MEYQSMPEAKNCPKCHSKNVVPIVYGYPTEETIKLADEGKIVHGGDVVCSRPPPKWHCVDCSSEW